MTELESNTTGVRVLPPIVFCVALIAGSVLHKLVPIVKPFPEAKNLIGGCLIFAALAIAAVSIILFRQHKTDIDPRGTATKLLQKGPFRYSRNPIYVALGLLLTGIGTTLNSVWIILMLIPMIYVLQTYVISLEEIHLRKQFGAEYEKYCDDVRRWF